LVRAKLIKEWRWQRRARRRQNWMDKSTTSLDLSWWEHYVAKVEQIYPNVAKSKLIETNVADSKRRRPHRTDLGRFSLNLKGFSVGSIGSKFEKRKPHSTCRSQFWRAKIQS